MMYSLEDLLKKPITLLLQNEDLKLIVQDDNDNDNASWETLIEVVKLTLGSLSSGYIEKESEDPAIADKIALLLFDLMGDYIRNTSYEWDYPDKTNLEVATYFNEIYTKENIPSEFLKFVEKYKWKD